MTAIQLYKKIYFKQSLISILSAYCIIFLSSCQKPDEQKDRVQSVTITPEIASLSTDNNIILTAIVNGAEETEVTWDIENLPELGTLSQQAFNTVQFKPSSMVGGKTQFVIRATSKLNPNKSAKANIDVIPNILGIRLESNTAKLLPNSKANLSVLINGSDNNQVQWTIKNGPGQLNSTTGSSNEFRSPLVTTETNTIIEVQSTIDSSKVALITLETRPYRTKIAASEYHGLAIQTNNTLNTWGSNENGILGNGTTQDQGFPTPITLPGTIIGVAAGTEHSIALNQLGRIYTWGNNQDGALGLPQTGIVTTPTAVELSNITQVAAGAYHSLALTREGKVYSWGLNTDGQLGLGITTSTITTPTPINSLENIVAISANAWQSLALKADGTVFIWGEANAIPTATEPIGDQIAPRKLEGLSNIVSIALGKRHGVALDAVGNVYTWGFNQLKATGHPDDSDITEPRKLQALSNIKAITAGANHTMAITETNDLIAWGSNQFGQLGIEPISPFFQAEPINIATNVSAITSGTNHSYTVIQGNLIGWGSNAFGQLGIANRTNFELPRLILKDIAQP
jgi:alpha-tubulin suppressor-like RCC1 family protein